MEVARLDVGGQVKVITVPDKLQWEGLSIFLAGGITNCSCWQDEVIKMLKPYEGTILNPRRKNFPIDDPNAAEEQITWEFNAFKRADIFSIWFPNSESDRPICMYELGRHITLRENKMGTVVIGVEPRYLREQDVYIQIGLIDKRFQIVSNLNDYAQNIIETYRRMENERVKKSVS